MTQLAHWQAISSQYRTVLEFLDWLGPEYHVELTWRGAKPGTPADIRRLLDRFFKLDQTQLEKERRELLESQRKANYAHSKPIGGDRSVS